MIEVSNCDDFCRLRVEIEESGDVAVSIVFQDGNIQFPETTIYLSPVNAHEFFCKAADLTEDGVNVPY